MKPIKLFLALLLGTTIAKSQTVKFSSEKPAVGSKVTFTYMPKDTDFKAKSVKCAAYKFTAKSYPTVDSIKLTKDGETFKGEVNATDSINLVGLTFLINDKKDANPTGYLLAYTKNGKFTPESYLNKAGIYGSSGNFYFGLKLNIDSALINYKKAFELKPELYKKYVFSYLVKEYDKNKENGTQLIKAEIDKIASSNNNNESDFTKLAGFYRILKDTKKQDSVNNLIVKKFPNGNMAYYQQLEAFQKLKELNEVEKKAADLITQFKLTEKNEGNDDKLNFIYEKLAESYLAENNLENFEKTVYKITSNNKKAENLNRVAWDMALKDKNIPFALKISKQSLDFLEQEKKMDFPPYYLSKDNYLKEVLALEGMYSDTYALLLYKTGKFKEALNYQERAVKYYSSTDPEIIEHYINYLIKDNQNEKAFTQAEKLLASGKAADSIKIKFKNLFTQLKKKGNAEDVIKNLEEQANDKKLEELAKTMINKPAPLFEMKNMKGELVKLADLKGKIVLLDYWATWCGPCKASFPSMQKVVEKYANNPDVVLLFVNTFQREENREKLVNDFIKESKYTFNVVYDPKDKDDANKFITATNYEIQGIPTKFIIDKQGNIRFKQVGYDPNSDIIKEIDMMLGLLNKKEQSK